MTKRLTVKEIINKCNIVHNHKYDYSKVIYKNAHTKVIVICHVHGEFLITINNHLHNKRNCPDCVYIKFCKNCTSNTEEFIKSSIIIHGDKYDYSKVNYVSAIKKVEIICKKHGLFLQMPSSHLSGKGCSKCFFNSRSIHDVNSLHDFIEKGNLIHNNYYDYSESVFENVSSFTKIICPIHGLFDQEIGSHLSGSGCIKCAKKSISNKEIKWLDSNNILEINRQYKLLINNKIIKVDGFDPSTNTIYEFYGDFWHGNPNIFRADKINGINKKTYSELYRKTMDREAAIKSAGYNFVCIWEKDFDILNMKERALIK